jgi:hypothetical protein
MSQSVMRDLPGLTNPITHAGRVVYNAQRDFLDTRTRKRHRGEIAVYGEDHACEKPGDDEHFTIQQYEVCMRKKKTRYLHSKPNDTDISCFSSLNGITLPKKLMQDAHGTKKSDALRRQALYDTLEFAGIASNRAIYDPNNNANEEGLAVQVGGLQTIYNTGEGTIKAGDFVMWQLPDTDKSNFTPVRVPGVPRTKVVVPVVAFNPENLASEFAALKAAYSGDGKAFLLVLHNLQKRIIGRAFSTAKRGKPFDILLGHYAV